MSDEINNCPECGVAFSDDDKQSIVDNGVCPHCKAKIEFSDVEYVDEEDLVKEDNTMVKDADVEEVEEIEDISDLQESYRQEEEKESSEKTEDEIAEDDTKDAKEQVDEEVVEETGPAKEELQIEKAIEGVKDKEDKNQMAIDIIDQRFLGRDDIFKDVHGSYISWYLNEGAAKKRGKRFLVVYRNGRNIKAQFFNNIKPKPEDNKNVIVIEPSGKTAYEYRSKDIVDFGEVIDKTFDGK